MNWHVISRCTKISFSRMTHKSGDLKAIDVALEYTKLQLGKIAQDVHALQR